MLTLTDVQIVLGSFELRANVSVPIQKLTAVMGPSGGGKSTLLSAIAGFVDLQGGRVAWGDMDITNLRPGARPISMLFQDNNLFPHLSVAQNVGLGIGPETNHARDDRVAEVLARVGLQGHADRKPGGLSGGQQSRVALARVLLAARPLMLLDEPFAALGPALKAEMLDLVREVLVGSGQTVVMVTHDPNDAQRIADQVMVVADGGVAQPVDTALLFADPPTALRNYLG